VEHPRRGVDKTLCPEAPLIHTGCTSDDDRYKSITPAGVATVVIIEPVSGKRCIEYVDQMQQVGNDIIHWVGRKVRTKHQNMSAQKALYSTTWHLYEQRTGRQTVAEETDKKWRKFDRCEADLFRASEGKYSVRWLFTPFFIAKFVDDTIPKYMAEQSIVYANNEGDNRFTVNSEEIQTCLAILILSGFVSLSR
jgi:hypothetical protein